MKVHKILILKIVSMLFIASGFVVGFINNMLSGNGLPDNWFAIGSAIGLAILGSIVLTIALALEEKEMEDSKNVVQSVCSDDSRLDR